jgi:hypothetical protein
VIDLTAEAPLPLAAAAKLVPPARGGKKTHLSTLLRWITRGAKGPRGEVVRLEAIRLGGRWMTTRTALQRFAEALTPHPGSEAALPSPTPRMAGQRQRAAEQAARDLDRLGIK